MDDVYASIGGRVEYDIATVARPIDDFIAELEELRDEEGVTHVVGDSGNSRGAKWTALHVEVV